MAPPACCSSARKSEPKEDDAEPGVRERKVVRGRYFEFRKRIIDFRPPFLDPGGAMSEPQLQEPPAVSLSLQEKHEQALKECDRLLDHFKTRAERNKHLFNGLKYSSIILTIGVTVLAALPANPIPWSVPVVAGLAALCTTLLSATHAQE